uniref:DUF7819 domain-containing protein n=1 Tax=Timema shepardi TaxID=629360 RepID=A0A7R9G0S5_TIMSH|nr:unnamed protein product [Timema shepardi]
MSKLPDLSKPPPGFPAPPQIIPEVVSDELMPSVPYFELPAGLMVPLIKDTHGTPPQVPAPNTPHWHAPHEHWTRWSTPSLTDSIRLPPPAPPSERLLAAVEAFYAPPCHDRPRDRRILDSEGWEKLGLYEYYRAKNAARRKKEEDIDTSILERSKSPSPIVRTKSKSKSPPKKRYRRKGPVNRAVEADQTPNHVPSRNQGRGLELPHHGTMLTEQTTTTITTLIEDPRPEDRLGPTDLGPVRTGGVHVIEKLLPGALLFFPPKTGHSVGHASLCRVEIPVKVSISVQVQISHRLQAEKSRKEPYPAIIPVSIT